jgi:hypothetical protein
VNLARHIFKTSSKMFLKNGDDCVPGQYVIARNSNSAGDTFVAQVSEIWQIKGSVADLSQMPDGILLQSASVARPADKYRMPRVELLDKWSLVPFQVCYTKSVHLSFIHFSLQDILCTVNTQHNCSANSCTTSNIRFIFQERERTEQTRPMVAHASPEDIVLNTAQMRDAIYVQRFRLPSETLDSDEVIMASSARESASQKAIIAAEKTLSNAAKTSTVAGVTAQQARKPRRLAQLQENPRASTSQS